MKSLTTAQGSFVTGSAIADAVARYDTALSEAGLSDRVAIPVQNGGGDPLTALIIIGWRHEIAVAEQPSDEAEILDRGVLESLASSTAAVRPVRGGPFAPADLEGIDWRVIGPDDIVY